MRESGILLPVFSLPSKYGIGCFSKEAYEFVEQLRMAGQRKWQILPLGPTGYGDSPYQSFSTFAGNPYFIDLETLTKEGLLSVEECESMDFGTNAESINYELMYKSRFQILHQAYERFSKTEDYDRFEEDNRWWLNDYSLFMAIKDSYGGMSWHLWDEPIRNRNPQALKEAKEKFAKEIGFYKFQQYQFITQWNKLHKFANDNGVEIIGDLPIYVAFDSADTWGNPRLFKFNEHTQPITVAGCPPDAFSHTGQLWGNPLYDWNYHKETNYEWWFKRIAYNFTLCDVVRIDHFRGFDEYYAVPAERKDAVIGEWEPGPSIDFFESLKKELGDLQIIAEDLGYLTESVYSMLEKSEYPGMKVLQFAFGSRDSDTYLPHTYTYNCVVYTGTHDNDTTRSWYSSLDEKTRKHSNEYLRKIIPPDCSDVSWDFIGLAMSSVAKLCIIPIQDYLCLGNNGRINMPSTLGNNWVWRMKSGQLHNELVNEIWNITKLYGRIK